MKKVLVLILCPILVLLIACTSSQNNESSLDLSVYETSFTEVHRLDIEFKEVISDSEIRANLNAVRYYTGMFGDKWREEMVRYFELMRTELDENVWELVEESQRRWEVFVESDIAVLNQAYLHAYNNATITLTYSAHNHYERYRNRALHLIMLYELLTADPNRV